MKKDKYWFKFETRPHNARLEVITVQISMSWWRDRWDEDLIAEYILLRARSIGRSIRLVDWGYVNDLGIRVPV